MYDRIARSGAALYDLGIGTGNALQFLPTNLRIFGFDNNLHMLTLAKRRYAVDVVQASILNLPVRDFSADIVLVVGVSEYITDIDMMFKELQRIMNSGSHALVTYSPLSIISVLRKFTGNKVIIRKREQFEPLIEQYGFEIIDTNYLSTQHQLLIKKIAD
ncbi:class I SAM-dependent methyltransferase [candidate division KSB1 bacterium]|nr:class I SAM-dependent methyltransferase [candidate division KSB1 bacterium]